MQDAVFKTDISGDFVLCRALYARYKKEGGGGMEHFERKGIGEALFGLSYPGRGILLGMGENGRDLFLSYFIMGRSENSRNRVFREEGEELRIDPACPERLSDPSLVLYSPLRSVSGRLIVANGDQSDTIHDFLEAGKSFEEALFTRSFEPDRPNDTPRISGIMDLLGRNYTLSILKAESPGSGNCARYFYHYAFEPGLGHLIHTYQGRGGPLPSFQGEPRPVLIRVRTAEELAGLIWQSLDPENRISLYVRRIDRESGEKENALINRFLCT